MLGSSNTYKTPVNLEPIWVANLILWASPPDNDPVLLLNVKYSKPTFDKNVNLDFISFTIKSAISACCFVNFKLLKNLIKSFIDMQVTS